MGNWLHRPSKTFVDSKQQEEVKTPGKERWKLPIPLEKGEKGLVLIKNKIVIMENDNDEEWLPLMIKIFSQSQPSDNGTSKTLEKEAAKRRMELKWTRFWFKAKFIDGADEFQDNHIPVLSIAPKKVGEKCHKIIK